MKSQILSVFPVLLQGPLLFKPRQTVPEPIAQYFKITHAAIDFGPARGFLQYIPEVFFGFIKPLGSGQINAIARGPTRGIGSADETSLDNIQQFSGEFVTALIDVAIDQADLQDFMLGTK